ncbi:MAG: hypothetical protein HYZ57_01320 [Acidobacteria bacterium]|nr:hypothetical protein [Acidobacteriota bacterium]
MSLACGVKGALTRAAWRTWAIVLFALATPALLQGENGGKHVLVFFGQWRTLPINLFVEQKLQAALDPTGSGEVEFYWESLDEDRLNEDDPLNEDLYFANVAEGLRKKYAGKQFDVIFATMPSTVRFLREYGPGVFGTTPVVFCIVNRAAFEWPQPDHFTGALTELHAGTNLQLMLRLHPGTRRILVVAGTSTVGRQWLAEAQREFHQVEPRVRVDVLRVDKISDLLTSVASLRPDTLVYFLLVTRTGDGKYVASRTVVASVSAAASVPVYVSDDRFVGSGGAGGYVIDNEASVATAVGMAAQLLAGVRISALPIRTIPNRWLFDARQLERWHIDRRNLSAGSDIRFRSPSMWKTHKTEIIGAVLLVLVETAFIVALVVERKRKSALQKRLTGQLEETRVLSARLITAHEEERRRLARELHDDVKQRVALIGLGLSQLRRSATMSEAQARVSELAQSANELALALGVLAKGLHPAALDHTSLDTALRGLCRESGANSRMTIGVVEPEPLCCDPPAPVKLGLFRIAQEALQNVAKHSDATAATVSLRCAGDQIVLTIRDNGRGFEMSTAGARSSGLGLLSMRERVCGLNGALEIETAPGSGTTVVASVPLKHEALQAPPSAPVPARIHGG